MFSKAVPAIIVAFVVGGSVGYGLSTTQALTAAAATADAVPISDGREVQITDPNADPICPPSQDIVHTPVSR
jgi:hypothetical protein